MADKTRYPQIPSTVWWGVRSVLIKTPSATVDERYLSVQLGVQEAAARAYLVELKSVGILTEEGKATALAQKWRLDESYGEAVTEILERAYPEGLLQVAPPGEAERHKVVSWFLKEGLGQGAAGNKAATYLLLSSPSPNEAPNRTTTASDQSGKAQAKPRETIAKRAVAVTNTPSRGVGRNAATTLKRAPESFPLNVNVQIHISADAGSDQIEAIFSAMRRYLYDDQGS